MYQREDKVNISFGQLNDIRNKYYPCEGMMGIDLIYEQHLRNECYKTEVYSENNKQPKNPNVKDSKTVTINGQVRALDQEVITRNQIICLAFDWDYDTTSELACNIFTLVYHIRNEEGWMKSGTLSRGETIRVVDGMRFDVADTSNA